MRRLWCLGALGVVLSVLAGCGGQGPGGSLAAHKISDLPGLLGGEAKPDPTLAMPTEVQTAGLATVLTSELPYRTANTPGDRTNWYESRWQGGSTYVVTLQPLGVSQDSDLYVFGSAAAGMQRLGLSRRGHAGNTLATPDWVAVPVPETGRFPIGVYGYSATTPGSFNQATIEVDRARLQAAGASAKTGQMPQGNSRWYYLNATVGQTLTVTVHPTAGDPDLFVYGSNSATLIDSATGDSGDDSVSFTATNAGRHYFRVYGAAADNTFTIQVTEGTPGAPSNLFFLHHSTGAGLVFAGDMRGAIVTYNTAHGTHFAFWDHGYNGDGLTDPAGVNTGTNYAIPNDNTDPVGLYYLWTSSNADAVACRNRILNNHEVIAFKSCFPASAIDDATMLQQYKDWYLAMRDFFDTRRDRLFVVMSPPPLHRLATTTTQATNARAFANWLKSDTYLSGHPNVVCFDLFDNLAKPSDGTLGANKLRTDYEISHTDSDSHPNELANQTVGPVFAQFLCASAAVYTPE